MPGKQILNFTENFLSSLQEFANLLKQPVIINKAYWEAVHIEKKKQEIKLKEKKKYYATIARLSKYGFITKKRKNGQLSIKLTSKGVVKLQRIVWKTGKHKKMKTKELCLVIFDIPEERRKMRDLFRKCLYELGFYRLQKSVFISYFDVCQEIKELVKSCELEKHVKILKGLKV